MKTITINSAKYGEFVVFVDDEDYENVMKYKWSILKTKRHRCVYVINTTYGGMKNGKRLKNKHHSIHRLILGITDPCILVDHIDRNPLNNQKSNLRICNQMQNSLNRTPRTDTTSKYKGVTLVKRKLVNKIR